MERHIVEYAVNPLLFEAFDEPRTRAHVCQQQVIHVRVVAAGGGDDGAAGEAVPFRIGEPLVVGVPDGEAAVGDGIGLFHLGPQEGGDEFARQKR